MLQFVGSVLEVIKQEKKLGAGSVRTSDRRPWKSLAAKARQVLDAHLAMTNAPEERARLLGLEGWVLLQHEGRTPKLKEIIVEAEQLAPRSTHIRGLAQAVRSMEEQQKANEPR